ncbi:MAG: hypothetical protein R3Y63_09480 [Eubacteriales bacterium]
MKKNEYRAELEKATPVLQELIIAPASKQEEILHSVDSSIVRTVVVMMCMGKNSIDNHRKKPYKHPIDVLKSWDEHIPGSYATIDKKGDIEYMLGKGYMNHALRTSMHLLSIF